MRTVSPIQVRRLLSTRALVALVVAASGVFVLEMGGSPASAHPKPRVAAKAAAPAGTSYVVKRGDTLSGLAARNKVTVAQLVSANKLASQHRITAGQTIVIPSRVAQPTSAPMTKLPTKTSRTFGFPDSRATPGQAAPASLSARANYKAMNAQFDRAAATHGVPAELLKALAWQESGWNNNKVSNVGAKGVGQIMPDTRDFVNDVLVSRPLDVNRTNDNIMMSAAFYRYLLDENKGDHRMALASYYQGLASVRRIGLLPETQQYVRSVLAVRSNWF